MQVIFLLHLNRFASWMPPPHPMDKLIFATDLQAERNEKKEKRRSTGGVARPERGRIVALALSFTF